MPRERIYEITGIQFMPINTVYQLLHRARSGDPQLDGAADLLFIECTFLDADAADATRKCHLTARQAGAIAAAAGVSVLVPFHFSPRYAGREAELRAEAQVAFGGPVA